MRRHAAIEPYLLHGWNYEFIFYDLREYCLVLDIILMSEKMNLEFYKFSVCISFGKMWLRINYLFQWYTFERPNFMNLLKPAINLSIIDRR